jgi:hypothetical protein
VRHISATDCIELWPLLCGTFSGGITVGPITPDSASSSRLMAVYACSAEDVDTASQLAHAFRDDSVMYRFVTNHRHRVHLAHLDTPTSCDVQLRLPQNLDGKLQCPGHQQQHSGQWHAVTLDIDDSKRPELLRRGAPTHRWLPCLLRSPACVGTMGHKHRGSR